MKCCHLCIYCGIEGVTDVMLCCSWCPLVCIILCFTAARDLTELSCSMCDLVACKPIAMTDPINVEVNEEPDVDYNTDPEIDYGQ